MTRIVIGKTHSLIYRTFSEGGNIHSQQFLTRLDQICGIYKHKWKKRNGENDPEHCAENPEITEQNISPAQIIFLKMGDIPTEEISTDRYKSIIINIPENGGYRNLAKIIKDELHKKGYNLY
ncbi:hypothetical protein J4406_02110 [Candidatus Woesearchaeota archaeon]|nr:hypothetical protein [Candidatus Woesearchaeota archaeon]